MDQENNLPTRRYQEVAAKLKPSMSGFRTIADEPRYEEMQKPNTRQMAAVSRTGTHNAVGGRSGVNGRVGGRTGSFGRVGSQTGIQTRVGGKTSMHRSVGAQTQKLPRIGSQTGMLPRVGARTGQFGSVSAQHSPVRKAQERSRRRQEIDPAMAILVGVGVFMFAIFIYSVSKPSSYTPEGSGETAQLSKEEQNRLARAINVERAKQAELLYRDDAPAAAAQPRVATPPPGSVIIHTVPAAAPRESAPRAMNTVRGGVASGMAGVDNQTRAQSTPAAAPEIIYVNEEPTPAAIPAKPQLAQGGIASGMVQSSAHRPMVPPTVDINKTVLADSTPAAVPGLKVQRSKKTAPHGGSMFEVGPGVALLEFTLDRPSGTLSLYVLDTVKQTRLMVRQPFVELQVPAYAQTFNLRSQSGSAQFSGQYEILRDNRSTVKAVIPSIVVNGTEVNDIAIDFQ